MPPRLQQTRALLQTEPACLTFVEKPPPCLIQIISQIQCGFLQHDASSHGIKNLTEQGWTCRASLWVSRNNLLFFSSLLFSQPSPEGRKKTGNCWTHPTASAISLDFCIEKGKNECLAQRRGLLLPSLYLHTPNIQLRCPKWGGGERQRSSVKLSVWEVCCSFTL